MQYINFWGWILYLFWSFLIFIHIFDFKAAVALYMHSHLLINKLRMHFFDWGLYLLFYRFGVIKSSNYFYFYFVFINFAHTDSWFSCILSQSLLINMAQSIHCSIKKRNGPCGDVSLILKRGLMIHHLKITWCGTAGIFTNKQANVLTELETPPSSLGTKNPHFFNLNALLCPNRIQVEHLKYFEMELLK